MYNFFSSNTSLKPLGSNIISRKPIPFPFVFPQFLLLNGRSMPCERSSMIVSRRGETFSRDATMCASRTECDHMILVVLNRDSSPRPIHIINLKSRKGELLSTDCCQRDYADGETSGRLGNVGATYFVAMPTQYVGERIDRHPANKMVTVY